NEYNFSKPYSEKTAELIDIEAKRLINTQYERAKDLLKEYSKQHNKLAEELMDKEVILADDVEAIFGKRKWKSRTDEIMALQLEEKRKEEAKKNKEENKESENTPTSNEGNTTEDTTSKASSTSDES